MALRGNLESFSLPEIFQSLSMNQHTGTLRVNDGESEKLIYFSGGEINLMASGKRETTKIGDFFIKTGRATPQQVQECLREQERSGKMLGQLLVDRGVIGDEDVRDAVRNKIEEEIYDLFLWKRADFEFLPGYCPHEMVDPLQKTSKLRINANSVIMESLRRMDEWERIAKVIPDLNLVFMPANLNPEVIGRIDAPENHKREIWLVDGKKSVNELVMLSMLNKFEFCKLMYECFRHHVVAPGRKEDMVRMGEEAVRRRDTEGVKKFFWNALNATPKDHLLRQRWAGHLKGLRLSREAFEQYRILGDQYLAEGNNASAIGFYQEALKLVPDDIATMRHLADALNRDNRTNEAVDLWVRIADLEVKNANHGEAIKIYLVLIEHRPEELNFYTQLGESYLALEQEESALRYYELALDKAAELGKQTIAQNLFLTALEKFRGMENVQRRLLSQVKGRVKVYLPNRVRRLVMFSTLSVIIVVALAVGIDVSLAKWRYNAALAAWPELSKNREFDKATALFEQSRAWIWRPYNRSAIEKQLGDIADLQERTLIAEKKAREDREAINKVLKIAGDFEGAGQLPDAREALVKLCRNEKYNENALVREITFPFRVTATIPGVEVLVDNASRGRTPLTLRLSPWKGKVRIDIRKKGFLPYTFFDVDPWTFEDLEGIPLDRQELWIYAPEKNPFKTITCAPVPDGTRLYVSGFRADGNASIAALEAATGKVIWETVLDTEGRPPGEVVRVKRKLVLGDGSGKLYRLAWDKGKLEKTSVPEPNSVITAGPILISKREHYVLLGTNTGAVFQFRAMDSARSPSVDLGRPVSRLMQLGERVAVSGETGTFRFYDPETNSWQGPPLELGSAVSGEPAVIENVAYVPTASGMLWAINLESAKDLWRYNDHPVNSDVIAVGNNLFFLDNVGDLHSLSYTKEHRWKRSVSDETARNIHGISISGIITGEPGRDLILVTGSKPLLKAFRPGDGNPMWKFEPRKQIVGPASYNAGYIYFATAGGRVYEIIEE